MTRHHRKSTHGPHRTNHVLAAVLAGLAGAATGTDYPPPPGAYRTDPTMFAELPSPTVTKSTNDQQGVSGPGARRLPLPGDGLQREPHKYGADKLFGSRETASRHRKQPPGQAQASTRFAPTAYPESSDPPQDGFSMDFGREDTGPPPARAYHHPGAPFRQGYPSYAPNHLPYAPGYSNYPQHPRQTMQYAPSAGPDHAAHPDAYRSAGPQASVSGSVFRDGETTQGYGHPSQGDYVTGQPQGPYPPLGDSPPPDRVPEPQGVAPSFYPGGGQGQPAPDSGTRADDVFRPPTH